MTASNPDARYSSCCTGAITTYSMVSYILESVADLRAMSITGVQDNELAQTLGYYEPGDGGGNLFYYDSAGSDTDDGGTVIKATSVGVGPGQWTRIN
jgi:hypothetical protein